MNLPDTKRICVFAGSNPGTSPGYRAAAVELGRTLVARGYGLVYGGGRVGLMGALADAVLDSGGHVTGVIPHGLAVKEVAHNRLPDLRIVDSMHERKALMAALSNGFVALPGGLGTLEELFEVLTWAQLGIHGKPCGVLNVEGYFDGLLAFIAHAVAQGFLRVPHAAMLLVGTQPGDLLTDLENHVPAHVEKWLDPRQT
jgi:uncharacterized protein (TIGR00730 family)